MSLLSMMASEYDTFFLTFKGQDRDGWVRIEAPTRDSALAYVVKNYDTTEWDELVNDVVFNPALYAAGELDAVRVLV